MTPLPEVYAPTKEESSEQQQITPEQEETVIQTKKHMKKKKIDNNTRLSILTKLRKMKNLPTVNGLWENL